MGCSWGFDSEVCLTDSDGLLPLESDFEKDDDDEKPRRSTTTATSCDMVDWTLSYHRFR